MEALNNGWIKQENVQKKPDYWPGRMCGILLELVHDNHKIVEQWEFPLYRLNELVRFDNSKDNDPALLSDRRRFFKEEIRKILDSAEPEKCDELRFTILNLLATYYTPRLWFKKTPIKSVGFGLYLNTDDIDSELKISLMEYKAFNIAVKEFYNRHEPLVVHVPDINVVFEIMLNDQDYTMDVFSFELSRLINTVNETERLYSKNLEERKDALLTYLHVKVQENRTEAYRTIIINYLATSDAIKKVLKERPQESFGILFHRKFDKSEIQVVNIDTFNKVMKQLPDEYFK